MPITTQNLPGGTNSDHRVYSNFFDDYHVIQNVSIVQPKNLLIDTFRRYFANDNYFTYRADEYGFPLTVDMTDLTVDSPQTTKILISDSFRHEIKSYPAILIKSNGGKYSPISFNQEGTIKYRKDLIDLGNGSTKIVRTPTHKVYAGIWDMSFDIEIYSESHPELEELTEICQMILQYTSFNELRANGLLIKSLSIGGHSAKEYANDYIFSHTISIDTRSEWRVEIPLENLIERIAFYFDIERHANLWQTDESQVQNLKYSDIIDLADVSS